MLAVGLALGISGYAAVEHFQIAARKAGEFPHLVELAEVLRFYANALLARST